jgi:hypothetical protein
VVPSSDAGKIDNRALEPRIDIGPPVWPVLIARHRGRREDDHEQDERSHEDRSGYAHPEDVGPLHGAGERCRTVLTVPILCARGNSLHIGTRAGRPWSARCHVRARWAAGGLGDDGRVHAADEEKDEERCRNDFHDDTSGELRVSKGGASMSDLEVPPPDLLPPDQR